MSEEISDWEEWKKDIPFWQHSVAGCVAGITEHSLTFPIDTLKTHIQVFHHEKTMQSKSIKFISSQLYKRSGYKSFFRGLTAIGTGCLPAHASLFSVYELSKRYIGVDRPWKASICGGLATMSHDLVLTPTDVVKQRLQLGCYTNTLECIQMTVKTEGIKAFYRSIFTTLLMNIPYGAIFVVTNEQLKKKKIQSRPQTNLKLNSLDYFYIAGISGGVAGFVTTPLDVIKTRLQTQFIYEGNLPINYSHLTTPNKEVLKKPLKYKTFTSTLKLVIKEEGYFALWKGAIPRILLSIPSTAICWGTYETVKSLFPLWNKYWMNHN